MRALSRRSTRKIMYGTAPGNLKTEVISQGRTRGIVMQGIVFSVRPPKKSWKNIANLSGGEKTLSSLSLVFALHHYKPTPLYVMDEIDAALGMQPSGQLIVRILSGQHLVISLRTSCNMYVVWTAANVLQTNQVIHTMQPHGRCHLRVLRQSRVMYPAQTKVALMCPTVI